MRRGVAIVVFVPLALGASVVGLTTAEGSSDRSASADSEMMMPILVRCPRAGDGHEHRLTSADEVIAVARRVNHREVTHYQGQAVRRTRWNTPVQGLVLYVGDKTLNLPGRRVLAVRAKTRCGKAALPSSAVTFYDSLSTVCCQTFTLFVAKGSRGWIVFKA